MFDGVPVKNGVLQFDSEGNVSIIPYSAEQLFTWQIDTNYNPDADTTRIKEIIDSWVDEENRLVCIEPMSQAIVQSLPRMQNIRKSWLFVGDRRGGKTTFTSALCRALGVNGDAVSSPTFSIVNEYKAGDGSAIFHFDFYRIEKIEEVLDIGFYDYIDSGALCIMEWPEKIEEILPEEVLRVDISISPDGARILEWED